MEKDTLRRHVYDEIHSQFEAKLREAKRQKSQVEEELEASSEKWRSERRRLNTEIDRLEGALADAKDTRKKASPKGGRGTETEELAKAQASWEEKLKKASQEWQKERASLEAEVTRLQLGLADLIERSNNPLRATQALREELEAKLKEALRIKKQREEELVTAQKEWEQEKIRLAAEMVKLRRMVEGRTAKSKLLEESREEELQNRLKEATRKHEDMERELQTVKADSDAAQKALTVEIAKLQEQFSDGTRQVENDTAARKQLKEAQEQQAILQQQATEARQALEFLHKQQSVERAQLTGQLEQYKGQIGSMRGETDRALQNARSESAARQKELTDEIAQLRKELKELSVQATSHAAGNEQLQEVMRHRNFLQQQVHQGEEAIRTIRAEQSVEHAQLTAQLEQSRVEANHLRKNLERELQVARNESDSLRQQLAAGASASETAGKQLQEVIQQRSSLEQQLRQTEGTAQGVRREQSDERVRWASQLEESRLKANQMIKGLESELQKTRDEATNLQRKLSGEIEQLRQEAAQAQAQTDASTNDTLQEILQQKNHFQHELHDAQEALQSMRREQSDDRLRWAGQLEESSREASEALKGLEVELQKTKDEAAKLQQSLSGEIEQLRQATASAQTQTTDTSAQLQELMQQRNQLQQQLNQMQESVQTANQEHSEERARWTAQAEESRLKESQALQGLESELERIKNDATRQQQNLSGEVEQLRRELAQAHAEAVTNASSNEQLRDMMQQRNYLQQQVHQAQEAVHTIRAEHSAERGQLASQLEQARSDIQHLERRLAETKESVSAEVVEQLRKQYDDKLQDIVQQKTRLAEELSIASSMIVSEQNRLAAATAQGADKAAVDAKINEELSRVEGVIQGISLVIDDPSIELSTVIRKNVERAEWDAYLKGILFSLGRGQGK